jgi:hypothetical protein
LIQPVKPAALAFVSTPTIGVALVCEALSGVLRVGVVKAGAELGGGALSMVVVPLSARLVAANVRAAIEDRMTNGVEF